jgi:hypothetical protein
MRASADQLGRIGQFCSPGNTSPTGRNSIDRSISEIDSGGSSSSTAGSNQGKLRVAAGVDPESVDATDSEL